MKATPFNADQARDNLANHAQLNRFRTVRICTGCGRGASQVTLAGSMLSLACAISPRTAASPSSPAAISACIDCSAGS